MSAAEDKFLGLLYEGIDAAASSTDRIHESQIASAIRSLAENCPDSMRNKEFLWENMAFSFQEVFNKDSATCFGPHFSGENSDGSFWRAPDPESVTAEMVEYWTKRAEEVDHPALKARYALLSWDFSIALGLSIDGRFGRAVIDASIERSDEGYYRFPSQEFKRLERVLQLSIQMKDDTRTQSTIDAILRLQTKVDEQNEPALWGNAFRILQLNQSKRFRIEENDANTLVGDLENRLSHAADPNNKPGFSPFDAERAAVMLAEYYRARDDKDNVRRVLGTYMESFELAGSEAGPLQAYGWLEKVSDTLHEFGVNDEAQRLREKLYLLGPKLSDGMATVRTTVEIPQDEIEKALADVVVDDVHTTLRRIAANFVPSTAELREQLDDLTQAAPLQAMIAKRNHDERGVPIASIGSTDDDVEGRIIDLLSTNLHFLAPLLAMTMDRSVSKHSLSADVYAEFLSRSLVFEPDSLNIIKKGLGSYCEGEFVSAIHVLMPQVERAFRHLLIIRGGYPLIRQENGDYKYKTLGRLFNESAITELLGDQYVGYFRALLTDKRGWNLRNLTLHGLLSSDRLGRKEADRIVHTLLVLGLVRGGGEDDDS